jgi:predicted secreted protein
MTSIRVLATVAIAAACAQQVALAQLAPPFGEVPTVTVSASASTQVANDRAHAALRAEAEAPDVAAAARQVNATIARAVARVKSAPGMALQTSGYSTYAITEKGRTQRWRVVQYLNVDSENLEGLAALVSRLQAEDGLLVSGMSFALTREAREKAEYQLVREAVQSWQRRAGEAARALGFASWRAGHVTVSASEPGRPVPMMRMAAAAVAQDAPVSMEGGFTEVTVTVSGNAWLDITRAPPPQR